MRKFQLSSKYKPAGDQPTAIKELCEGISSGKRDQVLLGATGTGKTFTMANVIQKTGRPALIMAHNKTLAGQLYNEMKEFFPKNAVEYFVSYYDYYQPEAYVARTDTFIEKDAQINEQIDRMRHSATRAMLERPDVIVVASVSCIYGIGSPDLYYEMVIEVEKGQELSRDSLAGKLVDLQYERNDIAFERGTFRIRGDIVDIFPSHYADKAWRIEYFGDEVDNILEIDSLTGEKLGSLDKAVIYANSHFVTPQHIMQEAIKEIKLELKDRLAFLEEQGKLLEAQRLKQRTEFDIEMLIETGSCKGIENYSRFFTGRSIGKPPPTLFEYLPKNALLFIDESHVTVPQLGAMYNGDRSRKMNLVEYGFRLPSALDNRPLTFDEWDELRPQTIYVSATPAKYELGLTGGEVVEQIIRPTGLVDPECIVRPVETQIDDLISECKLLKGKNQRVLVTTLTKKMAEDLSEYLKEAGLNVTYLHSEILTLERIEIIHSLRRGDIDVLVGVNLLREGLDIPECGLVAILDADKEGFLRSETSLIQTIGRAARNAEGRVILYADNMTGSLQRALGETNRRRAIQREFNEKHGITPQTIAKAVAEKIAPEEAENQDAQLLEGDKLLKYIKKLKKDMRKAAEELDFEKAANLRDQILILEKKELLS